MLCCEITWINGRGLDYSEPQWESPPAILLHAAGGRMKRSRIRRVSKKQAAINRSLALLVAAYLKAHPQCEFMMTVTCCQNELIQCSRPSTNVHHIRGRGKYTLDVTTFMACCTYHHPFYIHFGNPREAREKDYLLT